MTGSKVQPWEHALDRAIKRGCYEGTPDKDWPLKYIAATVAKSIHVLSESKREGAYQFLGAICIAIEEQEGKAP